MLLTKFRELLSHLNAEDNDMAMNFEHLLIDAQDRIGKLDSLEAGGVDNWSGYGDCFSEFDDE